GGPRRGARGGDTGGGAGAADGTRARRKREPIERKESYRWLEGYRRACAVAAAVPGTRIVSISDREGDIYECLAEAQTIAGPRAEWIIRSCQDRSTTTERSDEGHTFVKLRETVAARPVLGRLAGQAPRRGGAGEGAGPLGGGAAEAALPAGSQAA